MIKTYRAVFTSHDESLQPQGEVFHIEAESEESDPLWLVALRLVSSHSGWPLSQTADFLRNKTFDLRIFCDDGIVSADDIEFPWDMHRLAQHDLMNMRQSVAALHAAVCWVRETTGADISLIGLNNANRAISEQHAQLTQYKNMVDSYNNVLLRIKSIPDHHYENKDTREIDLSAQEGEM